MMSVWFSGQPVAKAVTKFAEVDRLVMQASFTKILVRCGSRNKRSSAAARVDGADQPLCAGHEGRDFDLDLGPLVDQPRDVEQRRGRKILAQRLAPGRADAGARGFVLAAAGQVPGQPNDVLGPRPGLRQ